MTSASQVICRMWRKWGRAARRRRRKGIRWRRGKRSMKRRKRRWFRRTGGHEHVKVHQLVREQWYTGHHEYGCIRRCRSTALTLSFGLVTFEQSTSGRPFSAIAAFSHQFLNSFSTCSHRTFFSLRNLWYSSISALYSNSSHAGIKERYIRSLAHCAIIRVIMSTRLIALKAFRVSLFDLCCFIAAPWDASTTMLQHRPRRTHARKIYA